ncbi:hypothetical protein [Maritalea sp.]|uniref:hypothetical protein n=1 Tax=Maritalea sp. TaxID=2003361 RepID=UPI003EF98CE8
MAQKPDDTNAPTSRPSLSIDWEVYADYLIDSDLTDNEKREFIEAIWYIVVSFVDLGFDVKSPDQIDANVSQEDKASETTPTTKKSNNTPAKEETHAIR